MCSKDAKSEILVVEAMRVYYSGVLDLSLPFMEALWLGNNVLYSLYLYIATIIVYEIVYSNIDIETACCYFII
jgi:hypothetical protein